MPQPDSNLDQRYAPPRAHVDDVVEDTGGLVLASRGQRFAAAMIDIAVILLVIWVASVLTPWNPWGTEDTSLWEPAVINTALGFVVFVLLQGVLLVRRGQTIGKAVLRLRIARPDGTLASPGRVLGLRYGIGYLLSVVPAIGQIYALVDSVLIFRASRRCLHDVIADTVVLKA